MRETDRHAVLAALKNVDFPAGKDKLVRAAEAAKTPEPAVRALRHPAGGSAQTSRRMATGAGTRGAPGASDSHVPADDLNPDQVSAS